MQFLLPGLMHTIRNDDSSTERRVLTAETFRFRHTLSLHWFGERDYARVNGPRFDGVMRRRSVCEYSFVRINNRSSPFRLTRGREAPRPPEVARCITLCTFVALFCAT